ncbi:MAG TPA: glycoside hydrolase family 2 TIM barrel-domain containing protein, partial [Tepidisphaeraceae bacterium]|nr:glycoside hydrolase family 2 TIM barrel-domain containing protein [Tepidisphaeraceae bacterium]
TALPHSVRLDPLNASGGKNFQGVCWYRKTLHAPQQWREKMIYLHFEGAMQVAEVWLNGQKIASHHCGYTPFTIDITRSLRIGTVENILLVRLDNSDNPHVPPGKPQAELDFSYFGGLYRNVTLEVMDRLHIVDPILANKVAGGGIFVTYPEVAADSAIVRVLTDVQNEHQDDKPCTVRQEIIDNNGQVIARESNVQTIPAGAEATFTHNLRVVNPKLWHPNHPHLYTLRTIVLDGSRAVDDQITRIGIRHIEFDRDRGLLINGEKFLSLGANRHQDHPYVGYALPDSAHWRDVKKLREAGLTSFRSHYPQAPAFMDACDEFGMLTIVSNPGWQFVGERDFQDRAVQNAREMVRRDRNRPSVILWEAALNESDNKTIGAALQQAVHEEFPGDQCCTGGDHEPGFKWRGQSGWDVEYLRNDGSKPYWIREWGDHVDNWSDQQSANRVARGWGELPMLMQVGSHLHRMDQILVEHQGSSSGERLAGACLWAGIDCQRGYHHQPFYGGILDLFRLPKFDYYFFQSQRDPQLHVAGLNDGPMVFIANFATFFSPTIVTIFSNCEQVRLLQDGKEIATQKPDAGHRIAHPPFTFRVGRFAEEKSTMYMSGAPDANTPPQLEAHGIINGKVVAKHVVRPPGVAAKLMLEADLCGRSLLADEADWVRVHARVCDARGTVCPFADDLIHFETQGEGKIISHPEIGANPMRAEAGIATALLRSTGRAGKIIVRATSFGLIDSEIEIEAVAGDESKSRPLPRTRRRSGISLSTSHQ